MPNASATVASGGTDPNGRAAQYAARKVRGNVAAFVSGLDGCGAGAVQFSSGKVTWSTNTRSFDEVVKAAHANRIQLWSNSFDRTPKIHYDKVTLTGRLFFQMGGTWRRAPTLATPRDGHIRTTARFPSTPAARLLAPPSCRLPPEKWRSAAAAALR